MYKVYFFSVESHVEIFSSKILEEAISFALSLHRSSNVAHEVEVLFNDEHLVTFSTLPPKSE